MKKALALLLTAAIGLSLAACGSAQTGTAPAADSAAETVSEAAPADEAEAVSGDYDEIEVMFWAPNGVPVDTDLVEEAINEITREKAGLEINLNLSEMASYITQVNLYMSAGTQIDLMVTLPGGPAHFNSMSSLNQLEDITDLLPEYAPDVLPLLPDGWLDATKINDRIYAVPTLNDKTSRFAFVCRTDILEETGVDPATIKTADDIRDLCLKAKELHPEMKNIIATGTNKVIAGSFLINDDGKFVQFDGLGDGDNQLINILEGDGTTIHNTYEREEYVHTCEVLREWYELGLISKDAPIYGGAAEETISMGDAFGEFQTYPEGTVLTSSSNFGHDMTLIYLVDNALITTGGLRQFTWAVPTTAQEPEAALRFLNLLYTDPEVINLITWGIEGEHYQVMEDGTIDFVNGENATTCKYYVGWPFLGNSFLDGVLVRYGNAPDLPAIRYASNHSANVTEFNGFSFNTDDLANQITVITSTVSEYRPSLACGQYTEERYNEFLTKLKDNGADEYIATVQEQLDAWLAAKGE
ncbi:MAG: ABC transporter substrate-binding protein [Lachnospiraceae bacterium]|nr:ABC transporter substrate-binding protein [Lachnospiraceae bacterium]